MKKKNDEKKKVQECCLATAHFQLAPGHDTTICIVTQGWEAGLGALQGRAWSATTRSREATTWPTARARGLAGGECCDTRFCIVTGAREWPLGLVSRYSLCIVTSGRSS